MAIRKRKNSLWEVRLTIDGKRRSWYVQGNKQKAERDEEIIRGLVSGPCTPSKNVKIRSWYGLLSTSQKARLASWGVLSLDDAPRTVCKLIDLWMDSLCVEPSTLCSYENAVLDLRKMCVRSLSSFGHLEAKQLLDTLSSGVADSTLKKNWAICSSVFNFAVRNGWIERNPLLSIRAKFQSSIKSVTYRPAEEVIEWGESMQNKHLKASLYLSRFCGLRVPSELIELKWKDFDSTNSRLTVRSPKNRKRAGKYTRQVPLSPAVNSALLCIVPSVAVDSELPIFPSKLPCGTSSTSWKRQVLRDVDSEVNDHKKFWMNLRASCEIDWLENHPEHVVSEWMNHSVDVSRRHYTSVTEDHLRKASNG